MYFRKCMAASQNRKEYLVLSFRMLQPDEESPCECFSGQAREGFRAGGTACP